MASPESSDPFQGSCILLYGPPKVGKTTLITSMPDPFVIATERGHRYVKDKLNKRLLYLPSAKRWAQFKALMKSGKLQKLKPKSIIIDTIYPLYDAAMRYVCEKKGIEHPADLSHGKGWNAVAREYALGLDLLADVCEELNATMVWVAHAGRADIQTSTKDYTRIQVEGPGQMRSITMAVPDHVWYLTYWTPDELDGLTPFDGDRCLYTSATEYIEAGNKDDQSPRALARIKKLPKTDTYNFLVRYYNKAKENELQKKA